jgi:hypothetical protein
MRLIEGILSRSDEAYLGMDLEKKPPEMSMHLSVLERGRLHVEKDGCWQQRLRATVKNKKRNAILKI